MTKWTSSSSGALCLEFGSGRRNIDKKLPPDVMYFNDWAWKLHEQDRLLYSVDSRLVFREGEKLGMQRLISIALLCIEYADKLRGR